MKDRKLNRRSKGAIQLEMDFIYNHVSTPYNFTAITIYFTDKIFWDFIVVEISDYLGIYSSEIIVLS